MVDLALSDYKQRAPLPCWGHSRPPGWGYPYGDMSD